MTATLMFRSQPAVPLRASRNFELGSRLQSVAAALVRLYATVLDVPRVRDITFLDDHEAVVRYRVGRRLLAGESVVENGRWKVSEPAFCTALPAELGARCPPLL